MPSDRHLKLNLPLIHNYSFSLAQKPLIGLKPFNNPDNLVTCSLGPGIMFFLFQWEVMPDLFFYRDPEEAEKEEKER